MIGNPKSLVKLSSFLAVVALFLGLAIVGCSDDNGTVSDSQDYIHNGAHVIVKAGIDNTTLKAMGPQDVAKYVCRLIAADGTTLLTNTFAEVADPASGVEAYTEYKSKVHGTIPAYRYMSFFTDQFGAKSFRIDYYDAEDNHLGFGCVPNVALVPNETTVFSNMGNDKDSYAFIASDKLVDDTLSKLIVELKGDVTDGEVLADGTISMKVGGKAAFRVLFTYADSYIEDVTSEAVLESDIEDIVAINGMNVTGKCEGEVYLYASYDNLLSNRQVIQVVSDNSIAFYPAGTEIDESGNPTAKAITSLIVKESESPVSFVVMFRDNEGNYVELTPADIGKSLTLEWTGEDYAKLEDFSFKFIKGSATAYTLTGIYSINGNKVSTRQLRVTTEANQENVARFLDEDGAFIDSLTLTADNTPFAFQVAYYDANGNEQIVTADQVDFTWNEGNDKYATLDAENMTLTFVSIMDEDAADLGLTVTILDAPEIQGELLVRTAERKAQLQFRDDADVVITDLALTEGQTETLKVVYVSPEGDETEVTGQNVLSWTWSENAFASFDTINYAVTWLSAQEEGADPLPLKVTYAPEKGEPIEAELSITTK